MTTRSTRVATTVNIIGRVRRIGDLVDAALVNLATILYAIAVVASAP